jgi:hypothetical protein
MVSACTIALCDNLNPDFGYSITIEDECGRRLLFTDCNPATGEELLTFADALEVAAMYAKRKGV